MDVRTQTALLASIVATALGLSMVLRPHHARVVTAYSLFAFSVAGFYLFTFLESVCLSNGLLGWPERISLGARLLSGVLVPSAALGFFLEFLGGGSAGRRTARRVATVSGILGLGVAASPLAHTWWGGGLVMVWGAGALIGCVSLLVWRIRQSDSRTERARLAYLATGAAASLFCSGLDLLPVLGIPFPTLGPVVTTLYLFFLAQTLLRLRLMDLHELLGKVASQSVLAVMLAAVFLVLTAWVKERESLFVFNTVLAAFVIGILLEPLRAKVDQQVVHIFFRERSELLASLSTLRARLANVIDVAEGAADDARRAQRDAPGHPRLHLPAGRGPPGLPSVGPPRPGAGGVSGRGRRARTARRGQQWREGAAPGKPRTAHRGDAPARPGGRAAVGRSCGG